MFCKIVCKSTVLVMQICADHSTHTVPELYPLYSESLVPYLKEEEPLLSNSH